MKLPDLIHMHLLLNHWPIIGTFIAFGLFVCALIGKSDVLKRTSLVFFAVIALLTIPTYTTGNGAQVGIKNIQEVTAASIEQHQGAAIIALIFMELTGAVAWFGLWQYRRNARPASWVLPCVFVLGVVTLVVMTITGNTGGEIRHPEILSGPPPDMPTSTLGIEGHKLFVWVANFMTAKNSHWSSSEILHYVGMAMLFGVVFLVNLRILGVVRNVSFAALHRLLPYALLGLGINLVTGMAFFMSAPELYTTNIGFQWKVFLIVLAGLNALYFTVMDEPWELGPRDAAPLTAKLMAVSAIFLWVGILVFGRLLPFTGIEF